MADEKTIYVYADYLSFHNELIGRIYVTNVRGSEMFSFEYEKQWLQIGATQLDPDLQLYSGRQYVNNKSIFGMFADSCPDRWGRRLMLRREELRAKKVKEKPRKLLESDFLLGVYDEARMGGLRFKIDKSKDFMSNDREYATPPWTSLRELEQASTDFENNTNINDAWVKMLLAPGSSLGGARPKACVMSPEGELWIAKFPSKYDDYNVGAWEMVVHELAKMCCLNVPEAKVMRLSDLGTTFLVKRFDREHNNRIHFTSAMNMLRKSDGDNASDGSSYLEIVSFLKANSVKPKEDLCELWHRIVFYMAVSNTDDHFRNHGFLLGEDGWYLSPMYDVNPDIHGEFLSLNVNADNSLIDYELAKESAPYYGVDKEYAEEEIERIRSIVNDNWQNIAKSYNINRSEIERFSTVFDNNYI